MAWFPVARFEVLRHQFTVAWVFLLMLFILGTHNQAANATAYTWNGSVSTLWATAANWTPNGVPGTADSITVTSATVDLGGVTRTILHMSLTGAFLHNGTVVLTAASPASSVTGSTTLPHVTINSGAVMNLGAVYLSGTVNNNGTVNWTGADSNSSVAQNTGSIFNNNVGAVLNVQANASWYNNGSGSQQLNNKGTLNRSGAGVSTFHPGVNLNNTGTLNATAGIMAMSDGTSTGTFNTVLPGQLQFNQGNHILSTGAKFTGTGSGDIIAMVTLSGNVIGGNSGGRLILKPNATLTTVAAGGTITGTILLTGGYVAGTINLASGATATWTGPDNASSIAANTGSIFNVNSGATFNAQANALWYNNGSGSQQFNVKGTLVKSGGGTTTTFNPGVNFNNTAMVSATSGVLALSDGTSTGTFNAVAPGAIEFNQSTHNLGTGAKCTGTGICSIKAIVNLAGVVVGGNSGGTLRLVPGGTLTAPVAGGTLSGTLSITGGYVAGNIIIASGGIVTWSGPDTGANVGSNTGSIFTVNPGGVFNAQANAIWYNNGSGSQQFNLKGTLNKTGTSTTSTFNPGVNFNNTGTANSTTGTLALSDGTSSGTFNVASVAFLIFNQGTHTLTNDATNTNGAKFIGTGATQVVGGFVEIKGNIVGGSAGGRLELKGGTLNGATGGGTVTGTLSLSGGYIGGIINIDSGGTATWSGSGAAANIAANTGSVFNVNVGGTMNALADATWYNNGSGLQTVNIKGTLNKTGAGTTSWFNLNINLNNTGTTNATTGILWISDGTSTGTFNTVAPGSILFNQSTHTLTGGAKFTGTGSTDIASGGTVSLNGSIVGGTGGGRLQLLGGTLTTVAGGGTVTDTLTLAGGFFGGTLAIPNGGVVNWVGSGFGANIGCNTNAKFNLNTGAVFNAKGSAAWYDVGTGGTLFNMQGTMNLAGPGSVSILVPYTSNANSVVNILIGGPTAGTQHDQLQLNGTSAVIAGSLIVGLMNNYVPPAGTTFQVISNSNGIRTGSFSFISSPFLASYDPIQVLLSTSGSNLLFVNAKPQTFDENVAAGTVVGTVSRSGSTAAALTVGLTNSNTSRVTIPASITIAAGAKTANFAVTPVNINSVDGNATATFTAAATGYQSGTTKVNILDDDVPMLIVTTNVNSFAENAADGTVTGTVTRNTSTAAALSVTVTSSNPSKVQVYTAGSPTPATSVVVSIPAGSASAPFNVHAVDNVTQDGSTNVNLTATASSFLSGVKTVTVTDNDNGSLAVIINSPTSFPENASVGGAAATTGKVQLQSTSATPVVVTLTSNNANKVRFPSATINNATNPPTATVQVTIPANTLFVNFNVLAVNNQLVDGNFTVGIGATATNYAPGSANVTVTDNDVPVLNLSIAPNLFAENAGNGAATATISRNTTNNAAALAVTLVSNNASKVSFTGATVNNAVSPPVASITVNIPANATSVNVPLNAINNALSDGNVALGLTASASGFISSSAGVTVTDDEIANMLTKPKSPSGASS